MSSLSIGAAIYIALKPLVKILANSAMGFYLAKKNVMSVETSRNISYLVVNFLAPALMFSRIIQAIDSDDMKIVGIIFLTSLMFQVYGIGFGTLTHYITPNPQNFFGGILMISALNNNGDLPIAYVTTLAAGTAFSPADGDKGVAYAIIFSTSTMISLFNCGGYRLIERDFKRVKEEPESDETYEDKNEESSETPAVLVRSESESELSHTTSRVISRPHSQVEADLNILTQIESHVTIPKKAPSSKINSLKIKAEPWIAKYVKVRDTLHLGFVEQFLLNFLKPTAFAAALAIIICVIPPVHRLFYKNPNYHGPHIRDAPDGLPPLDFIMNICAFLGNAVVPLGLAMLGATVARMRLTSLPKGYWKTIVSIVVFKLIVLPIIAIAWVTRLQNIEWIDKNDKMASFAMVMTACTPAATTQVYLTQMFMPETGTHQQLNLVSIHIICQYVALVVTLPIAVVYTLKNVVHV
ncbi:putative transporter [Yarrowia sp. C11]|nr:putative transporter [Yarrowia sp. E02]KAG5369107.1 putative transporter [Yarrowia sp. C11]